MTDYSLLNVEDLMSRNVISIEENQSVVDAVHLIDQYGFRSVIAVDEQGEVTGVLSITDLIGTLSELHGDIQALCNVDPPTRRLLIDILSSHCDNTLVKDRMTTPVKSVSPGCRLVAAAHILERNRYHQLPVVDENRHPIGIISTTDFVRAFSNQSVLPCAQ